MADIYAAYVNDSEAPPGEPRINPAELKPRKEGIMAICNKIGLPCIAPRRKINVMIVGNHSAGKSSYGVRAMPPMRLLPPALTARSPDATGSQLVHWRARAEGLGGHRDAGLHLRDERQEARQPQGAGGLGLGLGLG